MRGKFSRVVRIYRMRRNSVTKTMKPGGSHSELSFVRGKAVAARCWLRRRARAVAISFVIGTIAITVTPAAWDLRLALVLIGTVGSVAAAFVAVVGVATLLHKWLSGGEANEKDGAGMKDGVDDARLSESPVGGGKSQVALLNSEATFDCAEADPPPTPKVDSAHG
ncbi:hypothetical protein GCM10010402_08340 [Actinomadura luteofluorescens]|uniref:hypothetical protein n=1 Tax=Actinomadura luteofluorescens TaxID=46163 RepID=UPI00216478BF|nr:hypothetical protein [Actinomadura glauciflava]MCR3738388.1 hypothetical protein [Actinomadura glauciflava]